MGFCLSSTCLAATTWSGLLEEIAAAEDGGTVYVEADMTYTSAISGVNKTVTIASPAGSTNVITRGTSYDGQFLTVAATETSAHVILANVVVDGRKSIGAMSQRLATLSAGTLTLDGGAELRNVKRTSCGGIILKASGADAVFEMNAGSVVRGFENGQYGSVVQLGESSSNNKTVFRMNGGLITGCHDADTHASADWGGVIYNYGGRIYLHGGTITGNTSDSSVAGICNYSGKLFVSGDVRVVGNTGGKVDDVRCYAPGITSGGYLYFDGPFTGEMTVYGGAGAGWACYIVAHEGYVPGTSYMSGLGRVSAQGNADFIISGYATRDVGGDNYGQAHWSTKVATVGENAPVGRMREAYDLVRDGGEIVLCADASHSAGYAFPVTNGMDVTISSAGDRPFRLSRGASDNASMFSVAGGSLTVKNVILDGGDSGANAAKSPLVMVTSGGTFALSDGAVIENSVAQNFASALYVDGAGSSVTMGPDCVIRNCRAWSATSYGAAVRVASSETDEANMPIFVMNGGSITGCVCQTAGTPENGYGGMVYVDHGRLEMNGGRITENRATEEGRCAGVMNWHSGYVYLSGDATIAGNEGVDLYCRYNNQGPGNMVLNGVFRGTVYITGGEQKNDQYIFGRCEPGSSGAWNILSGATDPVGALVGYCWENTKLYLGYPDGGTVDGRGFSHYEKLFRIVPPAIDVDAEAETLPHTFGGGGLAAGGTVTVSFDPETLLASGRLPVELIASENRTSALTGEWNFILPELDETEGKWRVRPHRVGGKIVSYRLNWRPQSGFTVILR